MHGFVRQFDGRVQIFHVHHVQHRAKDFFLCHRHAVLHVIENRRADVETIRRFPELSRRDHPRELSRLLFPDGDQFLHAVGVLWRVMTAPMSGCASRSVGPTLMRFVASDQRRQNRLLRTADDHRC